MSDIFHLPKNALEYFDEYLGKYPYSTLTIVDPPLHGAAAGGMEYPTFITGMSMHGLPEGLKLVELVTVHEFGHQYFMGFLASNEFEEPWLDEGFNSYYEARIMDHYYGEKNSFVDFWAYHMGNMEYQRNNYLSMNNPKIAENFRPAWEFKHGGYGQLTYAKTATWLRTLEGLVGIETMDEIMKTYFERWKFKHPCAMDFIAVVNEIVRKNHGDKFGADMNWFFDQVLYGSDICDYKLAYVSNSKVKKDLGIFGDKNYWVAPDEKEVKEDENTVYKSRGGGLQVGRGENALLKFWCILKMERRKLKPGMEMTGVLSSTMKGRIKSFGLRSIPEEKVYVDKNFINNSYTTEPDKAPRQKYTAIFMFWVQNVMQTISMLI